MSSRLDKLKDMPPEQWTMLNVAVMLTEIYSDVKHLKSTVSKKASKWTENVLKALMVGVGIWVLNQVLNLIPTVQALIN